MNIIKTILEFIVLIALSIVAFFYVLFQELFNKFNKKRKK